MELNFFSMITPTGEKLYFWQCVPLLVLLSIVESASGATYYVDNSDPSRCADAPSHGSEPMPWATVSYGVNRIYSGDTLLVKPGHYEGPIYIYSRMSGKPDQPTMIRSIEPGKAVLRGAGINSGRVKITGVSNLVFDGFGVTDWNQGIYVEASTNVVVRNCEVFGIGQDGIHVMANSEYVTIEDCSVHDTGQSSLNGEAIYIGTGSAGPVDNSHHITVRNNTVFDIPTDRFGGEAIELKPGTHDCVIEGNTIYNSRGSTNWVGAIEVGESRLGVQNWPANPDHIIRNNVLHDVATAIRAGTGCQVYNNLIYGVSEGAFGIYVDNQAGDSHPRFIYHNTIDVNPEAAVRHVAGEVDIRNNIGPTGDFNLPSAPAFFVNATGDARDYHLKQTSLPIDSGEDLTSVVAADIDGISRRSGASPDVGAYEFAAAVPTAPKNPRLIDSE